MSTSLFAITSGPTPLFNTPDLARCFGGEDGDTLPLDEQNLLRAIETVLPPQSRVKLLKQIAASSIWRVRTEDYPYKGNFYLDVRFVKIMTGTPERAVRPLPSRLKVVKTLKQLEKTRYIWGGSWPEGIPLLASLYPCKTPLCQKEPLIQDTWILKGVDCSGLLQYATKGWTPRNTSSLVRFGTAVEIEGLGPEQIVQALKPLDLICWIGHVVCALDQTSTIESILGDGVVIRPSLERITEILSERKPVNNWHATEGPRFVVRRWHHLTF